MTYVAFKHLLKSELRKTFGETYKIRNYSLNSNNGTECDVFRLSNENSPVEPVIYIEPLYENFCEGYSMENIILDMLEDMSKVSIDYIGRLAMNLDTFDNIKDKIVYHLVSQGENKDLLKNIPWIPFHDMAITFYILLERREERSMQCVIDNNRMKHWNITPEELFEYAHKNTQKLYPQIYLNLSAFILGTNFEDVIDKDALEEMGIPSLYVITNEFSRYGATCILYEGMLDHIANCIQDDLIVFPSSVHGAIISPYSCSLDRNTVVHILTSGNAEFVTKETFLSNNVYLFKRNTKKLEIWRD